MLKGIGVSEGYGIGRAAAAVMPEIKYVPKTDCDSKSERLRFENALKIFTDNNNELAEQVSRTVGQKESEIILGHIMMMQDPYMRSEIEKSIDKGNCAEAALDSVCNTFIAMFSAVDDEMTKQRAADIEDIRTEILSILTGVKRVDLSKLDKDTVIVARELTPSMTACINKENVVGIITETGSKTSHAAILARAMEIPAVLSVENALEQIKHGDEVIVDGVTGTVIVSPSDKEKSVYISKRDEYIERRSRLREFVGRPTCTADGRRVELLGNIGTPQEAEKVISQDGEGIGLFRTEFLFMDRSAAPDENEQLEAYKKVLLTMKGKQVIIRTLDIGGDKDIPYLGLEKEENPFLGFRAIRYCLGHEEIFDTQLRALVRASSYGNLSVMIPLVTGTEEFRSVKKKVVEKVDEHAGPQRAGREHRVAKPEPRNEGEGNLLHVAVNQREYKGGGQQRKLVAVTPQGHQHRAAHRKFLHEGGNDGGLQHAHPEFRAVCDGEGVLRGGKGNPEHGVDEVGQEAGRVIPDHAEHQADEHEQRRRAAGGGRAEGERLGQLLAPQVDIGDEKRQADAFHGEQRIHGEREQLVRIVGLREARKQI